MSQVNHTTKILLCIGLLVLSAGCSRLTGPDPTLSEWKLVREAQTGYFNGLWFADRNNGWAVGDSGRVLITSDGGNSWHAQQSGTLVSLKCVNFPNPRKGWVDYPGPQKGWIGGADNSLGVSTDGGATWTWHRPAGESRRTFMAMSFVDENAGWVVDNFGGILHTENGGSTWVPQVSGTSWGITSVQFLDSQEGWATATNRVVLHTTDAGNNWKSLLLDSLDYGSQVVAIFDDICFVNRFKGWIAGTTGLGGTVVHPTPVICTTDAGKTWTVQRTPENEFIRAVAFLNDRVGWGASSAGILYTEDGGEHWTYQLALPHALFVDICLVDQSTCWALTFTGRIYRFDII